MKAMCDTFWGSHGCDLESGHVLPGHICGASDPEGICSYAVQVAGPPNQRYGGLLYPALVRYSHADGTLSEPMPNYLFHMKEDG